MAGQKDTPDTSFEPLFKPEELTPKIAGALKELVERFPQAATQLSPDDQNLLGRAVPGIAGEEVQQGQFSVEFQEVWMDSDNPNYAFDLLADKLVRFLSLQTGSMADAKLVLEAVANAGGSRNEIGYDYDLARSLRARFLNGSVERAVASREFQVINDLYENEFVTVSEYEQLLKSALGLFLRRGQIDDILIFTQLYVSRNLELAKREKLNALGITQIEAAYKNSESRLTIGTLIGVQGVLVILGVQKHFIKVGYSMPPLTPIQVENLNRSVVALVPNVGREILEKILYLGSDTELIQEEIRQTLRALKQLLDAFQPNL